MRFCTGQSADRRRKRDPRGVPPEISCLGRLDTEAGRGERGRQAEEQQEGRSQTVEQAFEVRKRHDTHLSVGTPASAGAFLI